MKKANITSDTWNRERKTVEKKNNVTKSWFFEEIKIDKCLALLRIKEKKFKLTKSEMKGHYN